MDTQRMATLNVDGKAVELPVYSGSIGPDVIDVRPLYGKTGTFTFDPGYMSTASCKSSITYIDGDKGEMFYRGYPIEQLAAKCNFLEVCYLLKNGELPNQMQYDDWFSRVRKHTMVHDQLTRFYSGFRRDAHPMAVLVGVVGGLSAFYHDSLDINNPEHRMVAAIRLIAKMPTIVAMAYRYNSGSPFMYPKNSYDYATNFLYMMFANPVSESWVVMVLLYAVLSVFLTFRAN